MKLAPLPTRTHIRSVPILDADEDSITTRVTMSADRRPPPAWVEAEVPDWQWQEFMAECHEQEQDSWK